MKTLIQLVLISVVLVVGVSARTTYNFNSDWRLFVRNAVRIDNSWDYKEKATNSTFQRNDRNLNPNYGGFNQTKR